MKIDSASAVQEWWGLVDFQEAYRRQLLIVEDLLRRSSEASMRPQNFDATAVNVHTAKSSIYVIGVEHPAVVSLGRRSQMEMEMKDSQLSYFQSDRGGLATVHSPGQLVLYPIMRLDEHGFGVRDWVCHLIQTSERTLRALGLSDLQTREDGVYTSRGKIASVGLRIRQGISYHGVSINLCNDLGLFQGVRICGVSSRSMDRWIDAVQSVPAKYSGDFGALLRDAYDIWSREFIDFQSRCL